MRGPNGEEFLIRDSGPLLATLDLRPGVDNSARDLAVRQALIDSPDLLSRGKLQEEPSGSGNFHIGSADDASARALAAAVDVSDAWSRFASAATPCTRRTTVLERFPRFSRRGFRR